MRQYLNLLVCSVPVCTCMFMNAYGVHMDAPGICMHVVVCLWCHMCVHMATPGNMLCTCIHMVGVWMHLV